jgi:hypothetical protein
MEPRTKRWAGRTGLLLIVALSLTMGPVPAHASIGRAGAARHGAGAHGAGGHGALFGARPPQHQTAPDGIDGCNGWTRDTSPSPRTVNFLYGVDADSSVDAWAVGTAAMNGQNFTLAEHWNGTSWSQASSPNPSENDQLLGVTAISGGDVWAVGYQYASATPNDTATLAEHFNGSSWSAVSTPNPSAGSRLVAVTATSRTDVWAAGYSYDPSTGRQRTLTEHFDGSAWSVVPSPSPATQSVLSGISAVSSNDVTAVGAIAEPGVSAAQPFAMHWDGFAWTAMQIPSPTAYASLSGVSTIASNDAWAVGTEVGDDGSMKGFSEHFDGSAWTVVPSDDGSYTQLFAVSAAGSNDIWAAGFHASGSTMAPLVQHWNGTAWVTQDVSGASNYNLLWGVTTLASGRIWAVGTVEANDGLSATTLIESFESIQTCGADLSVWVTDSPDPVTADSNLTLTVSVYNAGPRPATGVVEYTSGNYPAIFVSATPSQGSCPSPGECDLGTIQPYATARVTYVMTPIQPGTATTTASAYASGGPPDPNEANDTGVQLTTVRAQPNTTYVLVGDRGFSPSTVDIKYGRTVQWNIMAFGVQHSADDNTGLNLFASGLRNTPGFNRYTFFGAGTYDVIDAGTGRTSTVNVKMSAKRNGNRYRVAWAALNPPGNLAFNVEIKRPGARDYVDYFDSPTRRRNFDFTPDGGPGTYSFRATLLDTVTGASTMPSRPVSFKI